MKPIRIGNDLPIAWTIDRCCAPEDFYGKTVSLYLTNRYCKIQISDFAINGNVIEFVFPGRDQKYLGEYGLLLVETDAENRQYTVDVARAFSLVPSCTPLCDCRTEVHLVSDIALPQNGLSAYELWLRFGHEGTPDDFMAWLRQPATDVADIKQDKLTPGVNIAIDENSVITAKVGMPTTGGGEVFNDYIHNKASINSHAEGFFAEASGVNSHAEGNDTLASGNNSHAEGQATKASGPESHAEGTQTIAAGKDSHAEGYSTNARRYAHAEGFYTAAKGEGSHAEGNETEANGRMSHSEGCSTFANGYAAHAEGSGAGASGDISHAEGSNTRATNRAEHAQGQFNRSNPGTIHSIGIGTSAEDRRNAEEVMNNGRKYLFGIGGYDGTNPDVSKTVQDVISCKTNAMASLTWSKLKALRNGGTLVPGQFYRITDYITTVGSDLTTAKSAGHPFDIIALATSKNTLSEEAYAIQRENDAYFSNSDLAAWKLWYCLDNDTARFSWADAVNGKGVIYRMIDEFGNDCPYDFKNIRFKHPADPEAFPDYYYTFNSGYTTGNTDFSLQGLAKEVYGNKIQPYIVSGKQVLNANLFGGVKCYGNVLDYGCLNNVFMDMCALNVLGSECNSIIFGKNGANNILGSSCSNIRLGDYCYKNTIGRNCYNIKTSSADSTVVYHYFQHNIVNEGCSDLRLVGAETSSSSRHVQRYNITAATKGYTDVPLEIQCRRGTGYERKVARNSAGDLKIYIEADLVS